jgi:ornithine cyclodeaminase
VRTQLKVPDGTLLLMPAGSGDGTGAKLVTVNPSNPGRGLPFIHALYVFFDPETLVPSAVIEGSTLTAVRTGAVSGLATRHLARPDSASLVIFGAGTQANSHLDAMLEVRDIKTLVVVSRTRERAEALAGRARALGVESEVGGPDAVAGADIVCTCTTSNEPLFDGSLLRAGAHVNAVGAFEPEARELDDETMRRDLIVVESRNAALEEAGDLLIAIRGGAISAGDIVADLQEIGRGMLVRRTPEDITVFKSVGIASEDLAIAAAVVAAVRNAGGSKDDSPKLPR